MSSRRPESQSLRVEPVGPDQWEQVATLFGPRGATSGCWCMWWRKPNADWRAGTAEGNRDEFRALVRAGEPVGLLAYATDGSPVGWAAVAPRPAYPGLPGHGRHVPRQRLHPGTHGVRHQGDHAPDARRLEPATQLP